MMFGALAALTLSTSPALADNNEPAACLSASSSDWPAPARPYFMIALDTSSAMGNAAGSAPTCAGYASTYGGHARCAVQQAVQSFGGKANFGLSAMSLKMSGCSGTCFNDCGFSAWSGDPFPNPPGGSPNYYGCGPLAAGVRHSANILVPMLWDHFWQSSPGTCTTTADCPSGVCSNGVCLSSNTSSIVQWLDNDCTGSTELWTAGKAPHTGVLNDLYDYFAGKYTNRGTSQSLESPFDSQTPSRERGCRSANVILFAAGDDNCDGAAAAKAAAAKLYAGVTIGGVTVNVRTHVIAWAGGANTAQIAGTNASSTVLGSDGGHGYRVTVTDSTSVTDALNTIIGSAIRTETCDNADNDCNGCTDEGFPHYGDVQPVDGQCCTLARATCLAQYQASISTENPLGDRTLLPCTDAAAAATPATWLCTDPGETCGDAVDNNCDGRTNESCSGTCGAVTCAPTICQESSTCDGLGACTVVNKSAGASCTDDGNACTSDACDDSGGCAHLPVADGDPCGSGMVCAAGNCGSGCFIAGAFIASGASNPANACQLCAPGTSTTNWSDVGAGSSCDDGDPCTENDSCQAGACAPGTAKSCPAPDECHSVGTCTLPSGECSFTAKDDGSPCSGGTCSSGACVPTVIVDAGIDTDAGSDAGAADEDAGVVSDAGGVEDAGGGDSGVRADAGGRGADAGIVTNDGGGGNGARDASSTDPDASTSDGTASEEDASSCGCKTVGGGRQSPTHGAAVLLALASAFAGIARRRSRRDG